MIPIDPKRDLFLRMVEQQRTLGGRFSNITRLGANGGYGNFSLMFSADDSVTGERVALKVFNPEKRSDGYRLASFQREERLLWRFRGQPHIIGWRCEPGEFVDGFDTGFGFRYELTFSYFAMELAIADLSDVLVRGPFDTYRFLEFFRQMCKGVQRLHVQHVVHRDLKPDNFVIMKGGHINLSDLGTTRDLDPSAALLTDYGTKWPGHRGYTAPEMLAGLFGSNTELAMRADFFSLGAILFELFAGTNLSGQVFTPSFLNSFLVPMAVIAPADRRFVYEGLVDQLTNNFPLPGLDTFNPQIPRSVQRRIELLYRSLCHFDYRKRLVEYRDMFRQMDICQLILRNEEEYRKRLAEKRRRRTRQLARRTSR